MLKGHRSFRKTVAIVMTFVVVMSAIVFSPIRTNAASGSWKYDGNGWWFQYPGGGYPWSQWLEIGGSWYYFDYNGYMDSSGYREGCWLTGSGAWNPAYSGGKWKANSVGWWYEDSGWYPTSQWLKIDGYWYYFKADGYMAANEWVDGYYLGSDGAWVPGYSNGGSGSSGSGSSGSGSGSSGSGSSGSGSSSGSGGSGSSSSGGSGNSAGLKATGDSYESDDDFPSHYYYDKSDLTHSYDKIASVDGIDFVRAYTSIDGKHQYDWDNNTYSDGYGELRYFIYVSESIDTKNLYVVYNGDEGFRDFEDSYKQYIPNYYSPAVMTYAQLRDENVAFRVDDYQTTFERYDYMVSQGFDKNIELDIEYAASGTLNFDLYYKDTKITTISINSTATMTTLSYDTGAKSVMSEVLKYKSNMSDLELISASKYWYRQQNYSDGYTCWSCHGVASIMKCRGLSSVSLSCCYYREGQLVNDYGYYYALSYNRKVTKGDEYSIGHRICLVFTDSSHYSYVEVQGSSGGFEYAWEPSEAYTSSIYDKVSYLRDYDTVYDMVKGDYGVDLATYDPFDCNTWY